MNPYALCELCNIRNCQRTPKKVGFGYHCYKRRVTKSAFPLIEIALYNNPIPVLQLLHRFNLELTKSKGGIGVKPVKAAAA